MPLNREETEAPLIPLCLEKSSTAGHERSILPKVNTQGPLTGVRVERAPLRVGVFAKPPVQSLPMWLQTLLNWNFRSSKTSDMWTQKQEFWTWDFKIRPLILFIFGLPPKVTLDYRHIMKYQRKSASVGDRRRATCSVDYFPMGKRIGHRTEYCWFCCAG